MRLNSDIRACPEKIFKPYYQLVSLCSAFFSFQSEVLIK